MLILLSLAWGVLAALTADQHASAAAAWVAVSEPLSLDAEQIYTSLSDADATAANAFLAGGLEPTKARQRYQADITEAAIRIEAASALVGSSAARTQLPGHLAKQASAAGTAVGDDLAILSCRSASRIHRRGGTARADNRLGLPLGAAYLAEASALVRGRAAAASDIYTRESALLNLGPARRPPGCRSSWSRWWPGSASVTCSSARPGGFPAHPPGGQLRLLLATLAGLVSLVWLVLAFVVGRGDLLYAQQQGSAPAQAFARAEVAALQAHADESLTLIDNSGEDSYQQDYLAQQKLLGPGPGTLLAAVQAAAGSGGPGRDVADEARAWYQAHAALRAKDDAGNHVDAVKSAESGDAATTFARLSTTLSEGIDTHQAVFAASARSGRDTFTGLAVGMIVAALVMVAGLRPGPEPPARGVPVNARAAPPRALATGGAGGDGGVRAGAGDPQRPRPLPRESRPPTGRPPRPDC